MQLGRAARTSMHKPMRSTDIQKVQYLDAQAYAHVIHDSQVDQHVPAANNIRVNVCVRIVFTIH
jgi:hypothetical protein